MTALTENCTTTEFSVCKQPRIYRRDTLGKCLLHAGMVQTAECVLACTPTALCRDNLRGFFDKCFPNLLKRIFGYDDFEAAWLNIVTKVLWHVCISN